MVLEFINMPTGHNPLYMIGEALL